MQGSIIRDLVLVVAANNLIQEQTARSLWPDYEIFQYSKECVFVHEKGVLIATDPNAWLEQLQKSYDGLWLDCTGRNGVRRDLQSQAVAGGGQRWIIGAVRGETTELWEGGDELGDRNDPSGKIWNSGYARVGIEQKKTISRGKTIAEMKQMLDGTLAEIGVFARVQGRDNFADCFDSARAALTGRPVHDPILRNHELSREAAQLWQAIGSAWVFGGMGSWNDIFFDGDTRASYDRLTEALYLQLNEAVAVVANSTWPKYKMPSKEGTTWWQRLFMKLPPGASR